MRRSVNSVSERLSLYKELDNIEEEIKLVAFEEQLRDRFGPEDCAQYCFESDVRRDGDGIG